MQPILGQTPAVRQKLNNLFCSKGYQILNLHDGYIYRRIVLKGLIIVLPTCVKEVVLVVCARVCVHVCSCVSKWKESARWMASTTSENRKPQWKENYGAGRGLFRQPSHFHPDKRKREKWSTKSAHVTCTVCFGSSLFCLVNRNTKFQACLMVVLYFHLAVIDFYFSFVIDSMTSFFRKANTFRWERYAPIATVIFVALSALKRMFLEKTVVCERSRQSQRIFTDVFHFPLSSRL